MIKKLNSAKDRLKNSFGLKGGIDDVDGSWLEFRMIESSWISKIMLVVAEGHIMKIGYNLAKKSFIINLEDIEVSGLEDVDGPNYRYFFLIHFFLIIFFYSSLVWEL